MDLRGRSRNCDISNLRAMGAFDPTECFLYLANHAHEARTSDGQRLNDATDFAAWLVELARAFEDQALAKAFRGLDKRLHASTCPRCGHVHEGVGECGVWMGAGRYCRCELEVAA